MEAETSGIASQSEALCGIRSLGQWRSWAHSEQQQPGSARAAGECSTSGRGRDVQQAPSGGGGSGGGGGQHAAAEAVLGAHYHYQSPTRVQPKAPLEECPRASEEGVSAAFSPSASAGIRSLPNALRPGFRELMYSQVISLGRAALQQMRATSSYGGAPSGPHGRGGAGAPRGLHGGGLPLTTRRTRTVPLAGESPGRFSSNRGLFSLFDHSGGAYGARDAAAAAARAEHKAQQGQVSPADFVVRSCPLGLKSAPAFCGFSYDSRPHVEIDHLGRGRAEQLISPPKYGAFVPAGGRAPSPAAALKSQAGELLSQLGRQIGRDFPSSFLQAFLDTRGAVVVSFSRRAAAAEGDVTTYLNQLAKAGPVALQFRLWQDPARWGVVEEESDTVFFALWPPWSPHRPDLPESLLRLPPPAPRCDEDEAAPALRRSATEARGLGLGLGIRGLL